MPLVLIPLGLIVIGMLLRFWWLHAKAASSRVQAKEAKRADALTQPPLCALEPADQEPVLAESATQSQAVDDIQAQDVEAVASPPVEADCPDTPPVEEPCPEAPREEDPRPEAPTEEEPRPEAPTEEEPCPEAPKSRPTTSGLSPPPKKQPPEQIIKRPTSGGAPSGGGWVGRDPRIAEEERAAARLEEQRIREELARLREAPPSSRMGVRSVIPDGTYVECPQCHMVLHRDIPHRCRGGAEYRCLPRTKGRRQTRPVVGRQERSIRPPDFPEHIWDRACARMPGVEKELSRCFIEARTLDPSAPEDALAWRLVARLRASRREPSSS